MHTYNLDLKFSEHAMEENIFHIWHWKSSHNALILSNRLDYLIPATHEDQSAGGER